MAAIAVLMGVGFASCSKEGDPQYELVTGEKKIARLEINSSDFGYSLWDFKYDNAGKLLEATYNYEEEETRKFDYVWNNNAISSNETYLLNDGLIRNYNDSYEVSYYNGRPDEVKFLSSYGFDYTFNWSDDGRLSSRGIYYKMKNGEGSQSYAQEFFNFIYDIHMTTIKTKGFNPIVSYMLSSPYDGDPLCFAHPELIGGRTDILPTHFSKTEYWLDQNNRVASETIYGTCSYKFDNDGYVTECRMCEDNGDWFAFEETYTIVWE